MSVVSNTSSNTWTNAEFLAGACSHLDIGQSKASSPPQSSEQEDLTLKELRNKAVALALQTPRFFEDDPAFHKRFLLAIAKSNEPTGTESTVNVNISWLSQDRLSYKHVDASDPMGVVQDVSPKEPVGLPPTDGTWKPVEDRAALEIDAAIGNLVRSQPKPLN